MFPTQADTTQAAQNAYVQNQMMGYGTSMYTPNYSQQQNPYPYGTSNYGMQGQYPINQQGQTQYPVTYPTWQGRQLQPSPTGWTDPNLPGVTFDSSGRLNLVTTPWDQQMAQNISRTGTLVGGTPGYPDNPQLDAYFLSKYGQNISDMGITSALSTPMNWNFQTGQPAPTQGQTGGGGGSSTADQAGQLTNPGMSNLLNSINTMLTNMQHPQVTQGASGGFMFAPGYGQGSQSSQQQAPAWTTTDLTQTMANNPAVTAAMDYINAHPSGGTAGPPPAPATSTPPATTTPPPAATQGPTSVDYVPRQQISVPGMGQQYTPDVPTYAGGGNNNILNYLAMMGLMQQQQNQNPIYDWWNTGFGAP